MTLTEIETYINTIPETTILNYTNYWATLIPKTNDDFYKRFSFSQLSVHTSWQSNLKAYQLIESDPFKDRRQLRRLITNSGVGLTNMRTKGMWEFKQNFYNNPDSYKKQPTESWVDYRKRLMNGIHGLGLAKTAFAIEMCYPLEVGVTCLDTHALQLYGAKTKESPNLSTYRRLEDHWVKTCWARKVSPFIIRNIWFDNIQKQENSKYWTFVFEFKK
jgi:hypothetical protein